MDNAASVQDDNDEMIPDDTQKGNWKCKDHTPFQRRFDSLKNEYEQSWRSTHSDLKNFCCPKRGFFEGQLPNRGDRKDQNMIDSTPMRSARTLAALMMAGLTSPTRPWFKLGIPVPELMDDDEVKIWLDTVTTRMMTVFSKSNIYNTLHSVYEEIAVFGTGAAMILEDYDTVIRGRAYTVGRYYLACGPDGLANVFAKKMWMTTAQIVKEFGIDNVSETTKSQFESNSTEQWREVYLLIEENDDRIPGFCDCQNMKYRAAYWEGGSDSSDFLRISGYEEFPILAPRWDVTDTSDSYGKGPGWDALGDCKMLQKMQKDKLMGIDKMVNPPLQASVSIRSEGGVNGLPGGVTYFSGSDPNAGVKTAYMVQLNLAEMTNAITDVRDSIKECFFADLILMLTQGDTHDMTATEVSEKTKERMLMLGPVIERLEYELLDPLVDRTFAIMLRNGLIPPAPQSMQGLTLDVQYVSVMAQAQKAVGITSIQQVASFVGSLAGVFPEILDAFDAIEAATDYADMIGTPPKIMRSKDQIQAIQQQKLQAQQQQQQAQQSMAMVQGANTLSQTPVGQNSALDAMLGTTGMGGGQ